MLVLPAESVRYHQERYRGHASIAYGNLRGEVSRESGSDKLLLTGRTSEGSGCVNRNRSGRGSLPFINSISALGWTEPTAHTIIPYSAGREGQMEVNGGPWTCHSRSRDGRVACVRVFIRTGSCSERSQRPSHSQWVAHLLLPLLNDDFDTTPHVSLNMRSTLSLCTPPQSPDQTPTLSTLPQATSEPTPIPTIRLVSAIPSAVGSAPASGNPLAPQSPSISPPPPLAPKQDTQAPRRRLVPKKSRLGLLVSGKSSKTNGKQDLSDVVRCVGGSSATASVRKSGFEIYVEPVPQPHVAVDEVIVVKKKKSRASLSALKWGALGEVTNTVQSKDTTQTARSKNEDKEKWWTIGKGRKDSKDKSLVEKYARTDSGYLYQRLLVVDVHITTISSSWHSHRKYVFSRTLQLSRFQPRFMCPL
jgi:hypothetical protein